MSEHMNERIKNLLNRLSDAEELLQTSTFIAPCLRNSKIRTRVNRLIYIFATRPIDFEGWGIFLPTSAVEADLLEEAELPKVLRYLKLFKPIRVRLAIQLQVQTWLAYPINESDAKQRFGRVQPIVIHLANDGSQFESVVARFDGQAFWFECIDRNADPQVATTLKNELRKETPAQKLRFRTLTPEMRAAYELAFQRTAEYRRKVKQRRDEERLKNALEIGGGILNEFTDRRDHWTVEWTSRTGERNISTIQKRDLTVVSSGICLSGRDRDFDLSSLVGVIDAQEY